MPGIKLNNGNSRRGLRNLVLFTLLTMVLVGGVFAKYVYENKGGANTAVAKEFYFTSNMLTEDGKAEYTLNMDAQSITFTLGNNADMLRWSDDGITYHVTVTDENGDTVNNVEISGASGVLESGAGPTIKDITLSGLKPGETYIVKASGEAGYRAVLSAKFTVSDREEYIYKSVTETADGQVLLTVWTKNLKGNSSEDFNLNVSFPAGLIPDATDSVMSGINNYNGTAYQTASFIDATNFNETTYASHTYRFFKEDKSRSYNHGNFTVIMGTGNSAKVAGYAEIK